LESAKEFSRTFSGQLVRSDRFLFRFTLLHLDNDFNHETSLYETLGLYEVLTVGMADFPVMICSPLVMSSEGCESQLHHTNGAMRWQVTSLTPEGLNLIK